MLSVNGLADVGWSDPLIPRWGAPKRGGRRGSRRSPAAGATDLTAGGRPLLNRATDQVTATKATVNAV